ncbi:unnamed protein product [Polarella glacialis]|uniref:Secreted protein n=1 Tax=Polarella glacialis TaxID=89957 RepID=A0A813KHB5_POLGL|nr:unnamed protein product [Polarella glacialis]
MQALRELLLLVLLLSRVARTHHLLGHSGGWVSVEGSRYTVSTETRNQSQWSMSTDFLQIMCCCCSYCCCCCCCCRNQSQWIYCLVELTACSRIPQAHARLKTDGHILCVCLRETS